MSFQDNNGILSIGVEMELSILCPNFIISLNDVFLIFRILKSPWSSCSKTSLSLSLSLVESIEGGILYPVLGRLLAITRPILPMCVAWNTFRAFFAPPYCGFFSRLVLWISCLLQNVKTVLIRFYILEIKTGKSNRSTYRSIFSFLYL